MKRIYLIIWIVISITIVSTGTAAVDPPTPPSSAPQAAKDLDKVPLQNLQNTTQFQDMEGDVPDAAVTVGGILLEKGTRKVLSGITIYIRAGSGKKILATLTTDKKGEFQCRLDPGDYTLIIAAVGYDKFEEEIHVTVDKENYLKLRLVPLTISPYEIIVRERKESSEVSNQQLNTEEFNQIPGTSRDVLSSIKNLPGVASVSVFNGYGNGIVIRGSAQEDSLFLVNNHAMGNYSITTGFYHFGGIESIIEPELIESVDYIAGGFSAEYGDALGGVVSLNVKDPRTDRLGGYANLSVLSTSFMLEGPINDKDSFAVSLKRGFLGWYIETVEDFNDDDDNNIDYVEYPTYYDGSIIYRHAFSKDHDLKITTVAKSDSMDIKGDVDFVSERSSGHNYYKERFISMIGEWDYRTDKFRSTFSPVISYSYADAHISDRAYHKQFFDTYALNEKLEYQLSDAQRLIGGIGLKMIAAKIDSYSFALQKEGELPNPEYDREMRLEKDFFFYYPSLFLMDQIRLGRFTLTPGLNTIYDTHNEQALADPRFSLKYQLTEDTALKGATGLYSKMPLYDESVAPWGTKGLKPEKSIHGILGVEHQFNENITLDVQTYYKSFYDMVVRIDDLDPSRYDNVGSGHAYGAEILLRHQMTDHFFGWLSYAYSVARRKDGPGEDERYFDSDIPHNLTAVVSYKPNRYWSFGLKYTYASGLPYNDVDLDTLETLYDADTDTYYPLYYGPINNGRLKDRQQLDLRIDKYWIFNNFILSTYLDVRNVLQNKNIIGKAYNKDYSQREDALSIDSYIPLVFLGLKLDF